MQQGFDMKRIIRSKMLCTFRKVIRLPETWFVKTSNWFPLEMQWTRIQDYYFQLFLDNCSLGFLTTSEESWTKAIIEVQENVNVLGIKMIFHVLNILLQRSKRVCLKRMWTAINRLYVKENENTKYAKDKFKVVIKDKV